MKSSGLTKKICTVFIIVALMITLFSGCTFNIPTVYATNDVADYLYYPTETYGWCSFFTLCWYHDEVDELIPLIFPEKIEEYFSDVEYHLYADDYLGYCMEMALEFTIEDEELFNSYLQQVLDGRETKPFPYDENFKEYVICESATIRECRHKEHHGRGYDIYSSRIGKLLINKKEQRLIFYAMFAEESENDMNTENTWLFDRFRIDPEEYSNYTSGFDWPTYEECCEKAIFSCGE